MEIGHFSYERNSYLKMTSFCKYYFDMSVAYSCLYGPHYAVLAISATQMWQTNQVLYFENLLRDRYASSLDSNSFVSHFQSSSPY